MTQAARITLGAVNVAAEDPRSLAAFWAGLLGGSLGGGGDDVVFLAAREPGSFPMFFHRSPGAAAMGQRQHLDLTVPWGARQEEEVDRAVALGATHRWDVLDEVPWVRWSTLADPEGNLFCLAEHPPAEQS